MRALVLRTTAQISSYSITKLHKCFDLWMAGAPTMLKCPYFLVCCLLNLWYGNSLEELDRPCDAACLQGACLYRNCDFSECPGGGCTFLNSRDSSCNGGACTFRSCVRSTCSGGRWGLKLKHIVLTWHWKFFCCWKYHRQFMNNSAVIFT